MKPGIVAGDDQQAVASQQMEQGASLDFAPGCPFGQSRRPGARQIAGQVRPCGLLREPGGLSRARRLDRQGAHRPTGRGLGNYRPQQGRAAGVEKGGDEGLAQVVVVVPGPEEGYGRMSGLASGRRGGYTGGCLVEGVERATQESGLLAGDDHLGFAGGQSVNLSAAEGHSLSVG